MKAMGYASPAKQSVEGTNQTIEARGKPEGPALTALQQAQKDADAAQVSNQVANIVRNTSGTNKETARLKKRTARNNSATERKTKNAEKTQNRVDEREKSGKTRVGKVVDKIKKAASPAKQIDKAGQRIIRQGEKAKAAYKAGDTKKGDRHKVRAKRMNGRYNAKMLKNNLKGGRDEVSKFEKNVEIAEKFDTKIEKAKGNTKKIARLTKRANRKMDRSAN